MLVHASCVAIDDKAVLLVGPPGIGKSDLALRLIDAGAQLVADDQTMLQSKGGLLLAAPPSQIAGLIEIRNLGLVKMPNVTDTAVALYVELLPPDASLERLPEPDAVSLLDHRVQRLKLHALSPSAPAKIRAALKYPLSHD